jgi:hypothetical protein
MKYKATNVSFLQIAIKSFGTKTEIKAFLQEFWIKIFFFLLRRSNFDQTRSSSLLRTFVSVYKCSATFDQKCRYKKNLFHKLIWREHWMDKLLFPLKLTLCVNTICRNSTAKLLVKMYTLLFFDLTLLKWFMKVPALFCEKGLLYTFWYRSLFLFPVLI